MGKISIIIPVYNTEEYIEACLESLMNQTYKDLEILLIDDDSNTECKERLQLLSQKSNKVKIFHLSCRQGVGGARNFGIHKATGDFIYFMDSDDYLPEKTLELLVKNIGKYPLIRGKMRKTNLNSALAIVFNGLIDAKPFTENRFDLIKNNSALNTLFKKEFVLEESLSFSEDVKIYSDLQFMIPALLAAPTVPYLKEAIYFKRRRNDPVLKPSLIQSDENKKIKDFLHIFMCLKDQYSDSISNTFLDKQLLNFYRRNIVTLFKDKDEVANHYKDLSQAFKRIDTKIIDEHSLILKREAKAIKKANLKKYEKINSRHQFLRDIRESLKSRNKLFIFIYRRVFMKLSMKENLVFFESFLGRNYSDSPKYIYEFMLDQNMNYKYVWSFNEKREVPGNHIQVKRFSLKYYYYLARAKYWISNSRLPKYLDKRKDNIYLQTWHGTPLKKLVFHMNDIHSADPRYKQNFYEQSRRWDYLSSPNQYSSDIFREAFLYEKEMLEYGYPRNDILYKKNTEDDILTLKRKMNIPIDKKVVLYAPTWRDDEFYAPGQYKFSLQLNLKQLQNKLGEEYVVILRMHYFIASQLDISNYQDFVYDFSSYDDIAELYLISDILITDYSSVFFDYAHLKRPILFFTYDLEKYRDTLRGFYIDIEKEVPGPLVKTTSEIIESIENIEKIKVDYQNKYDDFYTKFCKWDDGNASEKTVKKVFKK